MNILSWLKGKKKQKEVRNYQKDENFSFEEDYYGDINIIDGFKILYCNNYNKISLTSPEDVSFISFVISIPYNDKSFADIIKFANFMINLNIHTTILYNIIDIIFNYTKENKNILIFLRGNLGLYEYICDNLYNNIITKYIRNNIFPNGLPINCPIEFENNIINSIDYPSKDIDILFIENNIISKDFKPVIGISISNIIYKSKTCPIDYYNKKYIVLNDRIIIITSIDKLTEDELDYIINNVSDGNKLITSIHKNINDDDINIDLDIDEII